MTTNRHHASPKIFRMPAVLTLLGLTACAGQGSGLPQSSVVAPSAHGLTPITTVVPLGGVSPATLRAQSDAGLTVPFYSGSVRSPLDGKTYKYSIVGSDPTTNNTTTTISYVPIEVVVTFPDGTVLDP